MIVKPMKKAIDVFDECNNKFNDIFGRKYESLETYKLDDAEIVFITCGAITGTTRIAVDMLREQGLKIGLIKIRLFRPFPKDRLINILNTVKEVFVLNRAVSYGAFSTVTQEVRAALYNIAQRPLIYDTVITLGGREVYPETIINVLHEKEKLSIGETNWL
jgi:pyruvate/2-oxoacid:ferredoxin oxidoreductase alpha subunit